MINKQNIIDSNDHRKLISAYDLGHIEEHSPGMIYWHPSGIVALRNLENFVRELHVKHGYQEVRSPILMSRELWEISGHWEKYRSNMFVAESSDGEGQYAVKPMSCPGQIGIYKDKRRSYRELPMALFEFGHVHRNESSGALSGWLRLRGFVQDDSHVFAEPKHLNSIVSNFYSMVSEAYSAFGFKEVKWKLSLRPENKAGSDEIWDEAEGRLREACSDLGIEVEEKPGDGAFYGPKLEAILIDRLGRDWQCGVLQVDFVLPERFELEYQGPNSSERLSPILIHHAILGSLERWIAICLEHNGQLPDWMAPIQFGICPIGESHEDSSLDLKKLLFSKGLRAEVFNNAPLGKRLKEMAERKIPHWVVIGDKEVESGLFSVRINGGKPQELSAIEIPALISKPNQK